MEESSPRTRCARTVLLAACLLAGIFLRAQDAAEPLPRINTRPLPEVAALMQLVEAHQKASEATIRNYLYTSTLTQTELNGRGDTKKTETTESDVFYIGDVRLQRVTRRNGKELTPDEQRKEKERIDKEIEKARGNRGAKTPETVTFARFLELGSFSNERRVQLRGRSTIALDYTGDPKAKTRNALEGVIHEMAGTVWIDEQDTALSRVEGRFTNNFKIGGGLIASIAKDTSFTADSTQVNGEVWLPASFAAQGSARALLFFSFNGRVAGSNTNFRRFKANSTILPGLQVVDDGPETTTPGATPAPR